MNYYLVGIYIATVTTLVLSHYLEKTSLKIIGKLIGYSLLALATMISYESKLIDDLSVTIGLSFSIIASMISIYTITYTNVLHYPKYTELLMDIFLLLITSSYIAPSFILLVIAWTISEIIGYTLIKIGEEHSTEGSLTSSRGFIFASTMTFELSVFTMIAISTFFTAANIGLYELVKPFTERAITVMVPSIIIPILVIGFLVKAANIPLHFWLPSAHSSAPSPASAALSGLMVSLGYYGLYRVLEYIDIENYKTSISWSLATIGFLSIIYGGSQALSQRDSKKLLAYSTIATNGFISIVFSIHLLQPIQITKLAVVLGILMHAAYKATLFCEAGLVEIVYGTRYIHGVKGFVNIAPISTIGGLLSVFSLLGMPGTLGFSVKLISVYCSLLLINISPLFALTSVIGILAYIIISALIALRYSRIYYGERYSRIEILVSEVSKNLQVAILLMGLLNVLLFLVTTMLIIFEFSYLLALLAPIAFLAMFITYSQFKAVSMVPRQ
ncbi:MAG: proton-conducting transporter membrane subunit [Desulfurococcaceae archaeon]